MSGGAFGVGCLAGSGAKSGLGGMPIFTCGTQINAGLCKEAEEVWTGKRGWAPFLRRERELFTPPDIRFVESDRDVMMVVDMLAKWKKY